MTLSEALCLTVWLQRISLALTLMGLLALKFLPAAN